MTVSRSLTKVTVSLLYRDLFVVGEVVLISKRVRQVIVFSRDISCFLTPAWSRAYESSRKMKSCMVWALILASAKEHNTVFDHSFIAKDFNQCPLGNQPDSRVLTTVMTCFLSRTHLLFELST